MNSSLVRTLSRLVVLAVLLMGCGTTHGGPGVEGADGGATPGLTSGVATQPMVTVSWRSTGGSCADEQTLVPRLVVYADGRVIRTDPGGLGQYCLPVPTFRIGHVDPAALRSHLEEYLETTTSAVDMSRAAWVADAGLTVLAYTAPDGTERLITADAVDVGLAGMTDEQRRGRVALSATIADLDELTPTTAAWTPSTIVLVKPAEWVPRYSSDQAPVWPVPISAELRQWSARDDQTCLTVTGPAATTVLDAARARSTAAATWTLDGRPSFLAVGVVLDGFPPCR